MKQYKYTLLKQDGSIKELGVGTKKKLRELNCRALEHIPETYYEGHGRCTMWGDEEGRVNEENKRNPHFKVLIDAIDDTEFDVVGDILKESLAK